MNKSKPGSATAKNEAGRWRRWDREFQTFGAMRWTPLVGEDHVRKCKWAKGVLRQSEKQWKAGRRSVSKGCFCFVFMFFFSCWELGIIILVCFLKMSKNCYIYQNPGIWSRLLPCSISESSKYKLGVFLSKRAQIRILASSVLEQAWPLLFWGMALVAPRKPRPQPHAALVPR